MFHEAFKHRSGRVISLGRLALASVFLLAVWLDPSQPTRIPAVAYGILAAYVLASAVQLSLTWNNWWRESRLAAPAHLLDIAIFTVMVFLTEGYTSPFFTFFVFLLLSATIRWGWRETAITAAVVILLFFLAGVAALLWGDAEFDLRRLLIRSAYLVVLSLILIWFGVNQRQAGQGQTGHLALQDGPELEQPFVRRALQHVASQTGAHRLVFAWWDKEEPWTNVGFLEGDQYETRRYGPGELEDLVAPSLAGKPFIFSGGDHRVITGSPRSSASMAEAPVQPRLLDEFDLGDSLVVPIDTEEFGGHIFASGVPGLCSDDLAIAERLGKDISAAFQRMTLLRSSEEAAAARTRLSLARDLHDSVVQLLAGTSFRLEAIRHAARSGQEIDSDVQALQTELAHEQRDLRGFISKLRGDKAAGGRADLRPGLAKLAGRLQRQWGVTCKLIDADTPVEVPARMEHDLHQLVREGVANAVRHGNATEVQLGLNADPAVVHLEIRDNGCGFPGLSEGDLSEDAEHAVGPWSLSERVRTMGGKLRLSSGPSGSTIKVALPLENRD